MTETKDDIIQWTKEYIIRADGAVALSPEVLNLVGGNFGDKLKVEINRTRRSITLLLPAIEKRASQ